MRRSAKQYLEYFSANPKTNRLIALDQVEKKKGGKVRWTFRCDCGGVCEQDATDVVSGKVVSCGCKRHPDMVGKTFGRLKVVEIVATGGAAEDQRYWKCLCECGKYHETQGRALRIGSVQSCGCLQRGNTSANWTGCGDLSGQYMARIKQHLKRRTKTLEMTVTKEYLWELYQRQNGKCALSGEHINFTKGNITASLDRINSDLGYLDDNVQWVHKDVNWLKLNSTEDDLIRWCCIVADYVAITPTDSA